MIPALLVVDVQYDFLPGGSLAVADGNDILPAVHKLLKGKWNWVAACQDFHPAGHVSFASTHAKEPFTSTVVPLPSVQEGGLSTIEQMLWPDHCVQCTRGAEIEESVAAELKRWIDRGRGSIVQKGTDIAVDAYSAFASLPSDTPSHADAADSPLAHTLQAQGVDTIFIAGLATDYCVRASALDARKAGFAVFVVRDAVRAVGGTEATRKVRAECADAGVRFASMDDIDVADWL